MENEIDLVKLKQIINSIFDHLSKLGITKVVIDDEADYYWDVPYDNLYTVDEAQPQLDIGRLSDDLEFLLTILKDEEQAVSLMFMHLAPLLLYVGLKVGK